jgi:hypothetical protein
LHKSILPCPPKDSKDKSRLILRGSQPRHRVKISERKARLLGHNAPVRLYAHAIDRPAIAKDQHPRIPEVIDHSRGIEPPKPDRERAARVKLDQWRA